MTPQNRPKYTGLSPADKTAGIGPQSRRREMKHLASTGPNLGTETEPTPPALGQITPTKMVHLASTGPRLGTETVQALGHNHATKNTTLSRYWPESCLLN